MLPPGLQVHRHYQVYRLRVLQHKDGQNSMSASNQGINIPYRDPGLLPSNQERNHMDRRRFIKVLGWQPQKVK